MITAHRPSSSLSRETFALLLAGGNGTRLGELTRSQCKPAIPFGAHFRNIDFTLSNCINSGIRRVAVLTQYKAQTLVEHITHGWGFLPRALGEFVDLWPAQQRLHPGWYAGTADAVYQNLDLVLAQGARYTLILAGDHIYTMDYRDLLSRHAASGADVTISCVPVPVGEASSFGVLGVDSQQRAHSFIEKPQPGALGVQDEGSVLASMGIYVFTTDYLVDALRRDAIAPQSAHDFGRDILPAAVRESRVQTHLFLNGDGESGYWRDVGTLEAYWQAHMDLLSPQPPIDLHSAIWPIRTRSQSLPPARLLAGEASHSSVCNSLLAGGSIVQGATVTSSVLGSQVRIGEGTLLDETVVLPGARVGMNCRLRRVIVDSGAEIPDGTVIGWGTADPHVALVTRDSIAAALRSVA